MKELPYWETINNYLRGVHPEELQDTACRLVKGLIRSRAFEKARMHGKYWQIIIDGTQLYSSPKKPEGKCLHRVHNRGTEKEYTEYYYYVLEAKIMLHPEICVSIMTEFAENQEEAEKQDCERKAFYRLIKRLREAFPCPYASAGTACMHVPPSSQNAAPGAAGTCCALKKEAYPACMGSTRN